MKLDIQDLKDRLDVLEGTTITSINEQISAINTSISDMKEMDESLDTYIKALEATATGLQKQINDANAEIAKVEAELGEEISVLEQTLLNELNTAKEAIEVELLAINNTLAELKKADEALDKKISDLQTYVDTQLTSTTNWANATFSTLAQYEQTQTEISTIKASIEQINAGVSALETRLNAKIASDIQAAIDALRSELSTDYIARIESAVNTMTQAYTTAISSAKDEITTAYTAAIATAIAESEANMQAWVNTVLTQGYYDIATIDGKLSALSERLDETDADLQKQIEEQRTALEASKDELTKAYKDAIKAAIEENNGVINATIASAVKDVEDKLQEEIDAISLKVNAMADTLAGLEGAFVNRIQSLKFIPEFSDRIVKFSDVSGAVLDFMVSPEKQADALANAWNLNKNIVKAYLRYTSDPSTRAVCEPIEVYVESVTSNGKGDVSVVVKENSLTPLTEDFWHGNQDAVIYLRISDGSNDVISELIDVVGYADQSTPSDYVNLSEKESANSYIVSERGSYKFSAVKGNSDESVGAVASAEVLWESFGTDVTPKVGDLVKNASLSDGYITFQTADIFKEGNAVIAAKDASGKILWSWHIWLTDQPQEHVYYNNAGTMMDRNLGATSATPGDVGALGLLYQWGRKDPFLGSSSISSSTVAKSTIYWPSSVSSNTSNGTIAYATANPTTFITYNSNNRDWYYTGSSSTDDTRWTTSESSKSIYDPCPVGWRVPDCGDNGVWSTALGSSSSFYDDSLYSSSNEGMNFSGKFGSDLTIWYPASGCRFGGDDGSLCNVGSSGFYWSASPAYDGAFNLNFYYNVSVNPSYSLTRAHGLSVRCLQEGSMSSGPSESDAVDLSKESTANSYIVSRADSYKFSTVKGNSSESVGAVASAEVLWESFGTDVIPNDGDLVNNVSYAAGYITFQTAAIFKEGNAVIAAKDASGKILWSWHIWFTDQPKGQVYYKNAGTMMDRNLGATSATPGDVCALGLLYQWGRKDPFLGSSSISGDVEAKSTITWPSPASSDSSTGTIAYATANPTTFITYNDKNDDWYYTGDSSTDNTRWTNSAKPKSIYDPCPAGWRVPDGGGNGVWSKATGSSSIFSHTYSSSNEGMNFSGKFGSASTIWYPASGFRSRNDGGLSYVGSYGYYWSAPPLNFNGDAYCLYFNYDGYVYPSSNFPRAFGRSVRCLQEGSMSSGPSESDAVDLSKESTANSYIVSAADSYKFITVKGNSSESVGAVASAEVLWESFGTDVTPKVGDLVKNASLSDGYITFQTADIFKEGNAVIAAKDASGKILWSWHIWLTDQPQEHVYYKNAGTMMDRNLGATSATPGDVGALGLLYQWGRKDPFLGSSSISGNVEAKSTITWPSTVSSNSSNGTISYATAHPTTFITYNSSNYISNYDWYYTGDSSTDNTRWTTSDKAKSIYDPCPAGWRVPDGGDNGVWSKATGSSSIFSHTYSSSNEGINFSGKFGSASTIWYPASGYRYDSVGGLDYVGHYGTYWSASPYNRTAYNLYFNFGGDVCPSSHVNRACGHSVRCLQE